MYLHCNYLAAEFLMALSRPEIFPNVTEGIRNEFRPSFVLDSYCKYHP